jgi:cytochrome c553
MKFFPFILIAMICAASWIPARAAGGTEHGKQLHEKHCVACHSSEVYTREKRMVNNFAELKERIRQCELTNDLAWFDEEIDAVVNYLNATYYKFETE